MNKKQKNTLKLVIGIIIGVAIAYYVVLPILQNIFIGQMVTQTVQTVGDKAGKIARKR